jgi:hypothetical protein
LLERDQEILSLKNKIKSLDHDASLYQDSIEKINELQDQIIGKNLLITELNDEIKKKNQVIINSK